MIQTGILNPDLLSLIARIRHTNTLVIADWAFPYWPEIETVDLALCPGIPTVIQVVELLRPNFKIGQVYMAAEFESHNTAKHRSVFKRALRGLPLTFEPHLEFKHRVPHAIGLVRTGDPTAYGNMILESA